MSQVNSNTFNIQVRETSRYASMSLNTTTPAFTGVNYTYGETATQPTPKILAWSGMANNSDTGKLYFFGGGHTDGSGNEVWEFDVETQLFTKLTTQHPMPAIANFTSENIATVQSQIDNTNFPGMWIDSTTPICRHTYMSLEWIDLLNGFLAGGGSTYGSENTWWTVYPNGPRDRWIFFPESRTWQYLGSSMLDLRGVPASIGTPMWSKARQRIITLATRETASYDPSKFIPGDYQSALNAFSDVLYNAPRVWEYDPVSGAFLDHATVVPTAQAQMPKSPWSLVSALNEATDTIGALGCISGTPNVWRFFTYPLASKTWTEYTVSGTGPTVPSSVSGAIYRLKWAPSTGKWIVHDNYLGSMYELQLSGNTATWNQLVTGGRLGTSGNFHATCYDSRRDVFFTAGITSTFRFFIDAYKV